MHNNVIHDAHSKPLPVTPDPNYFDAFSLTEGQNKSLPEVQLDAEYYEVSSMSEAQIKILGDEARRDPARGLTTQKRWEHETPYLVKLLHEQLLLTNEAVVLDYGCGIGRISSELIKKYNCTTVGIDLSASMRALAASYVDSPFFLVGAGQTMRLFGSAWADFVLAIWVFQHCPYLDTDIALIKKALKPKGKLFVVNELRLIPTREYGFVRDTVNVREMCEKNFKLEQEGKLNELVGVDLALRSWWATFTTK
jgi:SAM-dependent methyltransferase